MKIDKLDCCVKSIIYRFFMILLIYNWSPPLLYFGTSYIVQLRKHFHESTAQQTWKWETWKLSHTRFSLKLSIWYIITKTVWFYNYMNIQFLQVNWFPSLNFRHPLESKGCLKFIQRFPWIDFHHCCYQLIKITWLITIFIFIYWLLWDLTTPETTCTIVILKGQQV